jgi:hypothetical protein
MATVYSYSRFSSRPQEKGGSIKRQEASRDAWLAQHPEHVLDTTIRLSDLAKSASKGVNLDPEKGDLGRFLVEAQKKDSPIKKPLQQNSWVKFGSGRSPSVWYRAISMVS